MQIYVQDRLPPGLKLEVVSEFKDMAEMLKEEGIDQLVQPFYHKLIEDQHKPELKDQSWYGWEGYYCDQDDGTTRNLYTVGVLQDRGIWYSRCMRVKQVTRAQQDEVEKGMAEMMKEYMEGLLKEISRTIKPGSGKSDLWGLN